MGSLPSYLAHKKNCLPQLGPAFFTVKIVHGSPCSQRGGGRLEKSFDQDSLEASGSMNGSTSAYGPGADEGADNFTPGGDEATGASVDVG